MRTLTHILLGAMVGLIWAMSVLVMGTLLQDARAADCPTEDSCMPQYEDGQWAVVEVTP